MPRDSIKPVERRTRNPEVVGATPTPGPFARLFFRWLKPVLDDWWVGKILAYHEGLVARQQIGPPVGPFIKADGEVIAFPNNQPDNGGPHDPL